MAKKVSANWGKLLFLAMTVMIAAGPETASAQSVKRVYAQECAACHGPTGKGDGAAGKVMQPPVAPFSTALKGKSDSWIETVIAKGGPAVGLSPAMPPHPNLSGSQVKDLTQYIKGLNS
jgi:mono/diheme cytochrome c family protein